MAPYPDTTSHWTKRGSGKLPVLIVLLALSLMLSGCITGAGTPAYTDTALGTVRAAQGVTAANDSQTLDEYGLFYSTDSADVVAIDQGGSSSVVLPATIVTNPDVKQVRVILTQSISANQVGTLTVNAKRLTPGTTYYFRLYSIGRDSGGNVWRTLYAVGSHTTSNPTLKSLTRSKGTLTPSFSKTTYSYKNVISRYTSSSRITVVPTLSGSSVEMRIGTGAWSTVRSKLVSVTRGHSKTLYIKVTAPDGIVANYTVVVSRKS